MSPSGPSKEFILRLAFEEFDHIAKNFAGQGKVPDLCRVRPLQICECAAKCFVSDVLSSTEVCLQCQDDEADWVVLNSRDELLQ